MDKLTAEQELVLSVLDKEIEKIETKLAKAQPWIERLNRLKQTRRVLLSEKSNTGGGGRANAKISQEEVINFLRKNGDSTPAQIAEGLSVDGTIIRSHLNRHKDTTYERDDDGTWSYIGGE